jgi:hypothetical protein
MSSYQVRWLVEGKAVLFQLEGAYDFDVMRQAMIALDDELANADSQVYLVIDAERLADFARNFRELLDEMRARQHYDRFVWSLLITSNPIVRFFGSIASNLFRVKFRSVASLDEAVEVLARIDPALSTLYQHDHST